MFLSWGSPEVGSRFSWRGNIVWSYPIYPWWISWGRVLLVCDVSERSHFPKSWICLNESLEVHPREHVSTWLWLILKCCNFSVMLQRVWEEKGYPPSPASTPHRHPPTPVNMQRNATVLIRCILKNGSACVLYHVPRRARPSILWTHWLSAWSFMHTDFDYVFLIVVATGLAT